MGALSNELRLVMACCSWPPYPCAVAAAVRRGVDWPAVIALLNRHGVVALAANALWKAEINLPAETAAVLRNQAVAQTGYSLTMAALNGAIARDFSTAGIDVRFVKGPTLAVLAYADVGLKRSADIDVLVPVSQIKAACELLIGRGYEQKHAVTLEGAQFERYLRWSKEIVFVHKNSSVVELHARLSQNQRILTAINFDSDQQIVALGSANVPTFSDDEIYAYLCYHGAIHGWSRLKWLADLNAFVASRDASALHRAADRHGVGQASLVALSLCRDLFKQRLELPGNLSISGRFQRWVALRAIQNERGGSDIGTFTPAGVALLVNGAIIGGSLATLWGALAAMWSQPHVHARYAPADVWLFHLLRIPRFIIRAMGLGQRGDPEY